MEGSTNPLGRNTMHTKVVCANVSFLGCRGSNGETVIATIIAEFAKRKISSLFNT